MNFYSKRKPWNGTRIGIGFKSKTQLPLFMVWREFWDGGDVIYAYVIFKID
mgnify:CR=1 FL=1